MILGHWRKHTFEKHQKPAVGSAKRKGAFNVQAPFASKGFVYAAYSEGNGTKIGMTMKDDPKKRLRDDNTYVKHPYELLDFIHCDQPTILEGYIHIQLDDYKVGEHNRELFDLPDDLTMTFFHYIKKELNRGQDVSQDMVSDALTKTLEELQTPHPWKAKQAARFSFKKM